MDNVIMTNFRSCNFIHNIIINKSERLPRGEIGKELKQQSADVSMQNLFIFGSGQTAAV